MDTLRADLQVAQVAGLAWADHHAHEYLAEQRVAMTGPCLIVQTRDQPFDAEPAITIDRVRIPRRESSVWINWQPALRPTNQAGWLVPLPSPWGRPQAGE